MKVNQIGFTILMLVYNSDFYFIEKANGIKYLYAWLDRHPDVCSMVTKKYFVTFEEIRK